MLVKIIYLISLIFFCVSGFITYKAVTYPSPVHGMIAHSNQKIYQSSKRNENYVEQFKIGGDAVLEKIKEFWERITDQEKSRTNMGLDSLKRQEIQSENRENSLADFIEKRSRSLEQHGLKKRQNGDHELNINNNMLEQRAGINDEKTLLHENDEIDLNPAAILESDSTTQKDTSGDPIGKASIGAIMEASSGPPPVNESQQKQDGIRERSEVEKKPDVSKGTKSDIAELSPSLEKKKLMVVTFENGLSYYGQDKASSELAQKIKEALNLIEADPNTVISVEGHADNIPLLPSPGRPYNDNMGLSLWRATVIAAKLIQGGIPADRIEVTAYGDSHPIASIETAEGRAKNRRVEVLLSRR